jgi:ubiquinone/menaquinone biosynthesis C-methylase UbiE
MSPAKGYVDPSYLQATAVILQRAKQRTSALMQIQAGHAVLDVGCGPGTDTIALAQLTGSSGRVVGVDHDAAMIAEAERRATQANVSAWVRHQEADATQLPFAADTFDAVRSERLFQHLRDPEQALVEMVRVTRTGGWVVVLDTDWGTVSIDTAEVDIERRLARVAAERCLYNGYSGRQLYRLFKRQALADLTLETFAYPLLDYALARQIGGLDAVEREALSAGIVTADELQQWRASLERAAAEGVFFGSGSLVLVAGRKP